ncbi:hypothetical protein ABC977_13755 [Thioalkalicoccus limnaeus]|uniref:Transposase n=1 Tax=Thioalkalicoccus limnaeus TaxID=120681 RepID=A0ABV4BG06_9GAMM
MRLIHRMRHRQQVFEVVNHAFRAFALVDSQRPVNPAAPILTWQRWRRATGNSSFMKDLMASQAARSGD